MTILSPSSRSSLIFSTLSALFVLSIFYRYSNAVIAPNLVQDLRLNAETLGYLGGAIFYSFALFQIPMGPMLDRIGPRFVISCCSLIGAFGAFVFASGQTFATAFWGRTLIGIGIASVLMGSFKVFILRFPSERFTTLTGVIISVGTMGNILAASPLAYLSSKIGWRITFALAGGITAILGFLAFWLLGGEEKKDGAFPSKPEIKLLQTIRLVLGSLAFWQIGTITFFRFGTFMCLQGLWLGPYLMDIKNYSSVQAGNLLVVSAIGTIVGGPIAGRLADRAFLSKKKVALVGLSLYSLCLLLFIGASKASNPFGFVLVFFPLGFFNSFGVTLFSHAKDLFPISISGTVMAWINFFGMAGVAVFMPGMGKVIESFPHAGQAYPAEAYHFSFLICFLTMALSLGFYAFSKEKGSSEFGVQRSEAPH